LISAEEHYVVITKDSDFTSSFYLRRLPWKLLLVSTGNIRNADLEALFQKNIANIASGFENFDFIEMTRTKLIFHI